MLSISNNDHVCINNPRSELGWGLWVSGREGVQERKKGGVGAGGGEGRGHERVMKKSCLRDPTD